MNDTGTNLEETNADRANEHAAENRPALMGTVHMLPEGITDFKTHVGFAITVKASGKPATIMIPDATRVNEGAPVYITGRIAIRGENLQAFLSEKGLTLPPPIERLLESTEIACEAFYYSTKIEYYDETSCQAKLNLQDDKWQEWKTKHKTIEEGKDKGKYAVDEGPILIMFTIQFDKGIIGALTDNESLSNLFDITGGSIRVIRCPGNRRGDLEKYVQMLQAS